MKHVYLSWYDLEELISQLIFKLETPYDAILMIARGGIIPGGMIAEALKMHNVLTAAVLFSDGQNGAVQSMSWPRFVQFPSDTLLEGRKILIVDNLWSQGRTIIAAKGRIESAGGYPQVAVLHWKSQNSAFPDQTPDFYVEQTTDFIHYPWQRIDDSDYRILAHPILPSLS
ncbi:MAG: phosphoribosyltransferase family protein [Caldilineaceae bacterium]